MQSTLITIALTGGIATGKSTCCAIFKKLSPRTVVFDADACVGKLYSESEVVDQLISYFGSDIELAHGGIDKGRLREVVFSKPEAKEFLEQVFHPMVRKECLALLEQTAKNTASHLFVADIPLLFESGFDFGQSANLLVATTGDTQIDRLKSRNAWDDETIRSVLASQMPIEAKLDLADIVFWNEGPEQMLINQCQRFLRSLPCAG